MNAMVDKIEKMSLKENPSKFEIGDTVKVHCSIVEGEKTRTQIFQGLVIGMKGRGMNTSFTVRRIVQGEGVERVFPLHSPNVLQVEVVRHGKCRRAKLYYMRERTGKSVRLAERIVPGEQGKKKKKKSKKAKAKAEPAPAEDNASE